jgi:hypothetical protein
MMMIDIKKKKNDDDDNNNTFWNKVALGVIYPLLIMYVLS